MIKPEQIPDAVVKAYEAGRWDQDLSVAASIAAALSAWPGLEIERDTPWNKPRTLRLPLPQQENSDGK